MVLRTDLLLSDGTLTMGTSAGFRELDTLARSMSGLDPRVDVWRDEDEIPEVQTVADSHDCEMFTDDLWMCVDCGSLFPREPSLGPNVEEAIIEGTCNEQEPEEGEMW